MVPEEYFWTIVGALFLLAWGVLIVIVQSVRSRNRLRAQEMLHRERVLAMEKGLPLPEVASLEEAGAATAGAVGIALRNLAMVSGLTLAFLGIGTAIALRTAPSAALQDVWTLGFIPLFAGIGLLLYDRIARRSADGRAARERR